jgi:hypothetical protein
MRDRIRFWWRKIQFVRGGRGVVWGEVVEGVELWLCNGELGRVDELEVDLRAGDDRVAPIVTAFEGDDAINGMVSSIVLMLSGSSVALKSSGFSSNDSCGQVLALLRVIPRASLS